MKIPFDIAYRSFIESGEFKVETRDGSHARIICWDRHATEPYDGCILVVLVTLRNNSESAYYYYSDGHLWNKANDEGDSSLDLFIITPEPELTEFEEGVRQVVVSALSGETPNGSGGTMNWTVALSNDDVRKLAPRLLELAKKEICKGCSANLEGYIKGRQDTLKEMGDYMQERFTMENPNIQKLDPNVVINTTTSGTCKKD